jgi:uncharacterized protein
MIRIPILILLLIITLSVPSCRPPSLPEVKGDFLVPNLSQDSTESPLPAPEGFVSDFANILNEETEKRLEEKLAEFKNRAGIDFAVVTVNTTGDQSTFDYSLAVARGWGVGAANPDKAGLLILIAVEDRRWHIQISRVLERVLTNEDVAQLGSILNTPFREKRYDEGVIECVDAFIRTLSERRGVS